MHPSTQHAICGMISMMRESLKCLESLVAADQVREAHIATEAPRPGTDDSMFLSEELEDKTARLLGLRAED